MTYCDKSILAPYCEDYTGSCRPCALAKVDNLMPRAGLCNNCVVYHDEAGHARHLLAGGMHCKGMTMGCACECRKEKI